MNAEDKLRPKRQERHFVLDVSQHHHGALRLHNKTLAWWSTATKPGSRGWMEQRTGGNSHSQTRQEKPLPFLLAPRKSSAHLRAERSTAYQLSHSRQAGDPTSPTKDKGENTLSKARIGCHNEEL